MRLIIIFRKRWKLHLPDLDMPQLKNSMQLQCPMPAFDFDVITLGHGSGGLLTRKLLESGVFAHVTVIRSGDLSGTNFVTFTTAGGTAISAAGPNQDYSDATQLLTFLPAEASKTIDILINDNSLVHTNPTVNLTLSAPSNPSGGATLGLSAAVLTIIDNDVRFDLSQAAYAYSEGSANAVITVTRSGGGTTGERTGCSTSKASRPACAARAIARPASSSPRRARDAIGPA